MPATPYAAMTAMSVFVPIVSAICPFGTTANDPVELAVTDESPSCTQTGAGLGFVTSAIVGVPVVGKATRDDVVVASSTTVAVGANEAIAISGYPIRTGRI